ncbi:isoprenyl transferase [Mogibacterium diversum]
MLEIGKLPTHVAVIMDGNGRWAKSKNRPRLFGHNAGMQAMKQIVITASNLGIKYLTVYAFSTENWKRSTEEVSGIFKLIIKYVDSELKDLIKNNVRINILGDYNMLPGDSVRAIDELLDKTRDNDGLVFNIALNYGGRDEIVKAINEIIIDRKALADEGVSVDVTEDEVSNHLYTGVLHKNIPDPDLIIRTSGEERLSNFLIWQAAYSEMMFTDTLWPDYSPEEFTAMIEKFSHRKRRFGGREKEDK